MAPFADYFGDLLYAMLVMKNSHDPFVGVECVMNNSHAIPLRMVRGLS